MGCEKVTGGLEQEQIDGSVLVRKLLTGCVKNVHAVLKIKQKCHNKMSLKPRCIYLTADVYLKTLKKKKQSYY